MYVTEIFKLQRAREVFTRIHIPMLCGVIDLQRDMQRGASETTTGPLAGGSAALSG